MTDRELLEFAAKAAGIMGYRYSDGFGCMAHWNESDGGWFDAAVLWDPLTNDGDALRLAVTLMLLVEVQSSCVRVVDESLRETILCGAERDISATTRRAIVRAAAEIGKGMA